jgi:nitrogen fixation/metabolism regulation signal transduction histidine kinase
MLALTIYLSKKNNSPETVIPTFEKILNERYARLAVFAKSFHAENILSEINSISTSDLKLPKGFSLLIYKGEHLVFWTDNSFADKLHIHENGRIQFKPNGIYQYFYLESKDYTIVAADLIKHKYPYTNNYLSASFLNVYNIPPSWLLTPQTTAYPVKSGDNSILCYFKTSPEQYITSGHQILMWLFGLLFLLSVILVIFKLYENLPGFYSHNWMVVLFIADVALVRFIIQYFHIPSRIYLTGLFDASKYASSFIFPNLGDLLITLFTFLAVALFLFYYHNKSKRIYPAAKKHSILYLLLRMAALAVVFIIGIYIIDSIFINSTFELSFSRILNFTVCSYLAFIAIAMTLAAVLLFSYPILRNDLKTIGTIKYLLLIALVFVILFLIFSLTGSYTPNPWYLLFVIGYILIVALYSSGNHKISEVSFILLSVAILTGISGYSHYHNLETKEQNERKLLAIRLSTERDNIAEYMFSELETSIVSDADLKIMISAASVDFTLEKEVKNYLMNTYFKGYWNRYAAQITFCYPGKTLKIKPNDYVIGCDEYFNQIIGPLTKKTLSANLFYISEYYDASSYIARLPIQYDEQDTASVIIEFYRKFVPKGLGYPELLLDKSVTAYADISGYSYAIFDGKELVKNVGDYAYSEEEANNSGEKKEGYFFHRNGYNHFGYNIENGRTIIISKKKNKIIDILTPYTFQLSFHILLLLIIILGYRLISRKTKRISSFKTRLQLMMVGLILFASVLIGIIILNNIIQQNNKKNQAILSEKAHSVLIELEHKLSNTNILDQSEDEYLEELLTKFSLIFFSDINLYNPEGTLVASSRKEIFSEGLKSVKMQREAYNALAINKRTLFIMEEKTGNYEYLSAYIPFRDNQNRTTAFINLPYFARQQELQQEISSILVTIINIYVILTALAIMVSLIMSNHLTKPLQLIRDRFSKLNLSSGIEKIDYQSNDELGELINEYNLMVEKLTQSAEQLARSERESAWREMARQVAHEIKNPLTPMKLSIQHLEKAWNDHTPDWQVKLERTTKTLIQQIDSLSAIATAFSDFAKLPTAQNRAVDLGAILRGHAGLFSNYPNIDIAFNVPNHPYYVFADEKQLSRVFINLFTNAIQAINTGAKGHITITLSTVLANHKIIIRDNGIGMTREQQLKIFSPNFTTKSSGMGLGLAMVKNIIESAGGSITFSSIPGSGTTFTIELPEYTKDKTIESI